MSLLNTLRTALGLQQPLRVAPSDALLTLTKAGLARLSTLPDGHGIHVRTAPTDRGRVVQVGEAELQGPPPPGLGDRVTMSDADLHHLRGLALDFEGDRWRVVVAMEVRGRETPNPDGRLYLCTRQLAIGAPRYFAPGQGDLPDLPSRLLDIEGALTVLLREHTVTIEREPGALWPTIDRAVDSALRHHFLLCGHELTADDTVQRDDPLERAVQQILEERVLPGIHRDGGDLRLIGIADGVVQVSMHGACRSCPASTATLKLGVERVLRDAFPDQIRSVEQV
ncbi:MAG: Fe-S cluster biogenesis protein NfuA [Myxococcota bacterium]|jgi:Fe-S cluster biogenesis protein NfuA